MHRKTGSARTIRRSNQKFAHGHDAVRAAVEAMEPRVLLSNSIIVNTTADTAVSDSIVTGTTVSLREAVNYENNYGGGTISFDSTAFATPQTITLVAVGDATAGPSDLGIDSNITIVGPTGSAGVTLDNSGNARLFYVGTLASLTLDNLTLSGFTGGGQGGALYNASGGTVSLNDDTFSANACNGLGGAVYSEGSLSVEGSTFSGNGDPLENSAGGAIAESGSAATATVDNSTFTNNYANAQLGGAILVRFGAKLSANADTFSQNKVGTGGEGGGAIGIQVASAVVTNSTFEGNSGNNGAAILVMQSGSLTAQNDTLTQNASVYSNNEGFGGAIGVTASTASIIDSTIVANNDGVASGGGGIYTDPTGQTTLINSIVADNFLTGTTTPDDIGGAALTAASTNNLIGPGGSGGLVNGASGNIVLSNDSGLALGTLGDYGGPTQTIPLLSGSPAIGAASASANTAAGITTDQRGVPRPATAVDIGAFQTPLIYLSQLVPVSGPADGGSVATLEGIGFNLTGNWSVTMGGVPVSVLTATPQTITFTIPAMTRLIADSASPMFNIPVVFHNADGTSSTAQFFNYDAPVISSVTPSTGIPDAGGTPVTLTGQNFVLGDGSSLMVGGQTIDPSQIQSSSFTQIVFTAPPLSSLDVNQAAGGLASVFVQVTNPAGQSSGNGILNYSQAPVTVTSSGSPVANFGYQHTYTATIYETGSPTGTVQFQVDGNDVGTPVSVVGGVATFATKPGVNSDLFTVGTHTVTAIYSGDSNVSPGATGTWTQRVVYAPSIQNPPGTFSATGYDDDSAQFDHPGYFTSTPGAIEETSAPVGRYISGYGAVAATDAPMGYYVPTQAATAATEAQPGYFVPITGAATETEADPGYYVSSSGQSGETPASPGYYVPIAGQAAQTPDPAGTTSDVGAVLPTPIIALNPIDIAYGTPLADSLITGNVSFPGTFAFSDAGTDGTILDAGTGQSESVTFTPQDTTDLAPATGIVTIEVDQATPTVTAIDNGGTYNGQPFPASATVTDINGNPLDATAVTYTYYTVNMAGNPESAGAAGEGGAGGKSNPGNLTDPTAVAPTDAGNYAVVASYPGDTDYAAAHSDPTNFTIAQAAPTITVTTTPGGVYTGNPVTAAATVTGLNSVDLGAPTIQYFLASDTQQANPIAAPTDVGSYDAVISYAGSTDYAYASTTVPFAITAATPAVAVADAGGKYTGNPYPATATVAGVDGTPAATLEGVAPTLAYYTGSTTSGPSTSTAPTGPGTFTVVANFPGSQDYAAASSTPLTFTIAPSKFTPTLTNLSAPTIAYNTLLITLGGSIAGNPGTPAPTGTVTISASFDGKIVATRTKTLSTTGRNAGDFSATFLSVFAKVGQYTLTYSYSGDANYAAAITTTVGNVTYNTNASTPARTKHGGTVSLSLALTDVFGLNVGSSGEAVMATGIAPASNPSVISPLPAGNSAAFTYSRGEYTLNLKTTGLSAGTYVLYFTAAGDPVVHSLDFVLS